MSFYHSEAMDSPCKSGLQAHVCKTYQVSTLESEIDWDMVKRYFPLLKSIVGRMQVYFPDECDIEDLYSIGMAGLIKSAQNYDKTRNLHFGSYAAYRIRGALLDELRRLDWLSQSKRQGIKALQSAIEDLTMELKRPPQEEEVANRLGISLDEYYKRLDVARPLAFISLNESIGKEEGDFELYEAYVADDKQVDIRTTCETNEFFVLLRGKIEQLDLLPKKVLLLYYYQGLRLSEIATLLELTESRICQIHTQALMALKLYFNRVENQTQPLNFFRN